MIGDGEIVMPLVMRVQCAIPMIQDQSTKQGDVKLIVSNFQKNEGILFTSDRSTVEVDSEVSRHVRKELESERISSCRHLQFKKTNIEKKKNNNTNDRHE